MNFTYIITTDIPCPADLCDTHVPEYFQPKPKPEPPPLEKAPKDYPVNAFVYRHSAAGWRLFIVRKQGRGKSLHPLLNGHFDSWQRAHNEWTGHPDLPAIDDCPTILEHTAALRSIRPNAKGSFKHF